MTKQTDSVLTRQERMDYRHDVIVIGKYNEFVIEWCKSVLRVKARSSWKFEHKTWDEFCQAKIGKTGDHVTRLLRDVTIEHATHGTLGNTSGTGTGTRLNDRAKRAMRSVPKDKRDAVLESANAAADRDDADTLAGEHIAQGIRDVLKPPVKDMEGHDAPQRLADIFDLAEELKTQVSMARAISKTVLAFAQKDGGAFIKTGVVKTLITRLAREIGDAIPWALCAECAGEGCLGCRKRGWFTKSQMKELD